MRFSRSVLAVAASRDLFVAPVQPELAPMLSGAEAYPTVYEAFAAPADFDGAYGTTEYVVEQSSTDLLAPALVVVALALAGYSYGRGQSAHSEEFATVEEYDPSALELAGAFPADVAMLGLQGRESRREVLAKAGAALASMAAVQSASAKAGQFSRQEIFSVVGSPGISSPYVAGGPKAGQIGNTDTTYGFAKSDGEILAKGYEQDVSREKAGYAVSARIIRAQGKNLDNKTWWLVRDNFRGQAYNMKSNMLAINKVLEPKAKASATRAYKKFWTEIEQLDLACVKKELDLAKKEYGDVLEALTQYEKEAGLA